MNHQAQLRAGAALFDCGVGGISSLRVCTAISKAYRSDFALLATIATRPNDESADLILR
jgi:hypothetical protein